MQRQKTFISDIWLQLLQCLMLNRGISNNFVDDMTENLNLIKSLWVCLCVCHKIECLFGHEHKLAQKITTMWPVPSPPPLDK